MTTELARTRRPATVPVLSREAQLAVDTAVGAVGLTVAAAVVTVLCLVVLARCLDGPVVYWLGAGRRATASPWAWPR